MPESLKKNKKFFFSAVLQSGWGVRNLLRLALVHPRRDLLHTRTLIHTYTHTLDLGALSDFVFKQFDKRPLRKKLE